MWYNDYVVEAIMTIYRNKRDGKLYILSHNKPPCYTGSWLEFAPYRPGNTFPKWKKIPHGKESDFIPVGVR